MNMVAVLALLTPVEPKVPQDVIVDRIRRVKASLPMYVITHAVGDNWGQY